MTKEQIENSTTALPQWVDGEFVIPKRFFGESGTCEGMYVAEDLPDELDEQQ